LAEEVIEETGFCLAKSTLHEAYLAWSLEAPGRPPVSIKHLGMVVHRLLGVGEMQASRRVELPTPNGFRVCRPFHWIGLRLIYPNPSDPWEIEARGASGARPDAA